MKTGNHNISLRELPVALKIAMGLFAIHILLYAEATVEAITRVGQFQPSWLLHLLASSFLMSQIPRPRKAMFYVIIVYSLLIPSQMLNGDFVAGCDLKHLLHVMYRTIIVCVPLYLVAPFLIAGRSFYMKPNPDPTEHAYLPPADR